MGKIEIAVIEYENMHGYVDEKGYSYNETKLSQKIYFSTMEKLRSILFNKTIKPSIKSNIQVDDIIRLSRISLESKIINHFFDEISDE